MKLRDSKFYKKILTLFCLIKHTCLDIYIKITAYCFVCMREVVSHAWVLWQSFYITLSYISNSLPVLIYEALVTHHHKQKCKNPTTSVKILIMTLIKNVKILFEWCFKIQCTIPLWCLLCTCLPLVLGYK